MVGLGYCYLKVDICYFFVCMIVFVFRGGSCLLWVLLIYFYDFVLVKMFVFCFVCMGIVEFLDVGVVEMGFDGYVGE